MFRSEFFFMIWKLLELDPKMHCATVGLMKSVYGSKTCWNLFITLTKNVSEKFEKIGQ